jgi:hypothetical protein
MFDLLFVISIIGTAMRIVKEVCTKPIPAENWANKELYHKDIMDGVSIEQRMSNLENGKYKLMEHYQKPSCDSVDCKNMIDNHKMYYEDMEKYGAYKAQQLAKKGKYKKK